jgi:uncharacterized MAPEG superfamily protein
MSQDKEKFISRPSFLNVSQTDALKGGIGVPALYISAATHVAPFLSKPNGLSQRYLVPFWHKVFSLLRLGTPVKGKFPISLLMAGAAVTLIFTASGSIWGNAAGNRYGYSNKEPRVQKRQLTGVYGRFASTHDNLLEFFGAFAAAAILASQNDAKGSFDNTIALIATMK